MANILILAGTTEGRELAEAICKASESDNRFFVSVATGYGKSLLPESHDGLEILADRLTEDQLGELIDKRHISMLIDATHPYAELVTQNSKKVCEEKAIEYVRLLRSSEAVPDDAVIVNDSAEAALFLTENEGNVLLTTGSKELNSFTCIPDYKERLYPRILPIPEMIQQAFSYGFDAGHLICMQGPFTYEMNLAMLRQIGVSWLVTKESGKAGGFLEKVKAAKDAGVKLVVIGRPVRESGVTLGEAKRLCGLNVIEKKKYDWFPLFTNIKGKNILVVGAGKIASRRINILKDFSCNLTVVATLISDSVRNTEGIKLIERTYEESDIDGMDIVLAATDDAILNDDIGERCESKGILVNIANRKESCDFLFPAMVKNGDLIVGITAGGKDHSLVANAKKVVEKAIYGIGENAFAGENT